MLDASIDVAEVDGDDVGGSRLGRRVAGVPRGVGLVVPGDVGIGETGLVDTMLDASIDVAEIDGDDVGGSGLVVGSNVVPLLDPSAMV